MRCLASIRSMHSSAAHALLGILLLTALPLRGLQAPTDTQSGGITEDELRQRLVGKPLYLRGNYLDDTLGFNEHGQLTGHAAVGSYTLCGIEIEKLRLTKHRLELYGARYGLHFLGAMPYEDPSKSVDRVRLTPPKKLLRITIDREIVVKPKKLKDKKGKEAAGNSVQHDGEVKSSTSDSSLPALPTLPTLPSDPHSVTTTTSPAHAATVLREALDHVFAPDLDASVKAGLPAFWQLYYRAVETKTDFRPTDPSVLPKNAVDRKAHLLSSFEPPSNEYAQKAGVAGMALYHVVLDASGRPTEIAVARPIGFGLDENAVEAIGKARFEPAQKDGKPVAMVLDLVVQFRIFSQRTAAHAEGKTTSAVPQKISEPILPGPYSRQP
jgi:TonB family protein